MRRFHIYSLIWPITLLVAILIAPVSVVGATINTGSGDSPSNYVRIRCDDVWYIDHQDLIIDLEIINNRGHAVCLEDPLFIAEVGDESGWYVRCGFGIFDTKFNTSYPTVLVKPYSKVLVDGELFLTKAFSIKELHSGDYQLRVIVVSGDGSVILHGAKRVRVMASREIDTVLLTRPSTALPYSYRNIGPTATHHFTNNENEGMGYDAVVDGMVLRWKTGYVEYWIHEAGTADCEGEFNAIRRAFWRWEADPGSYIRFSYAGTVGGSPWFWGPFDLKSVIWWRDLGETGLLARTFYRLFWDLNGPYIWQCDTEFNDYHKWSTTGEQGAFDVESVMVHEAGHWLLLDDLWSDADREQAMYRFITAGKIKREISWGDIAGVRWLYPRTYSIGGWYGSETQGADITLYDIDGNSRLDVIVAWMDNPGGENSAYYRIGWDISCFGGLYRWTEARKIPGWFGSETQGLGVAITNIDSNPRPELIVAWIDNPWGSNKIYYRIGWNLDKNGYASSWSNARFLRGDIAWDTRDLGIAIGDINDNNRPDMVFAWALPTLKYPAHVNMVLFCTAYDINSAGYFSKIGEEKVLFFDGDETAGLGVALINLDNNSRPDLIVMRIRDTWADNFIVYKVGYNLDSNGNVSYWSDTKHGPGWNRDGIGWCTQGGGISAADIGNYLYPELIFFWVDNPSGENSGYYRVEFESRINSHL